jgi:hypothetical protein
MFHSFRKHSPAKSFYCTMKWFTPKKTFIQILEEFSQLEGNELLRDMATMIEVNHLSGKESLDIQVLEFTRRWTSSIKPATFAADGDGDGDGAVTSVVTSASASFVSVLLQRKVQIKVPQWALILALLTMYYTWNMIQHMEAVNINLQKTVANQELVIGDVWQKRSELEDHVDILENENYKLLGKVHLENFDRAVRSATSAIDTNHREDFMKKPFMEFINVLENEGNNFKVTEEQTRTENELMTALEKHIPQTNNGGAFHFVFDFIDYLSGGQSDFDPVSVPEEIMEIANRHMVKERTKVATKLTTGLEDPHLKEIEVIFQAYFAVLFKSILPFRSPQKLTIVGEKAIKDIVSQIWADVRTNLSKLPKNVKDAKPKDKLGLIMAQLKGTGELIQGTDLAEYFEDKALLQALNIQVKTIRLGVVYQFLLSYTDPNDTRGMSTMSKYLKESLRPWCAEIEATVLNGIAVDQMTGNFLAGNRANMLDGGVAVGLIGVFTHFILPNCYFGILLMKTKLSLMWKNTRKQNDSSGNSDRGAEGVSPPRRGNSANEAPVNATYAVIHEYLNNFDTLKLAQMLEDKGPPEDKDNQKLYGYWVTLVQNCKEGDKNEVHKFLSKSNRGKKLLRDVKIFIEYNNKKDLNKKAALIVERVEKCTIPVQDIILMRPPTKRKMVIDWLKTAPAFTKKI